MRSLFGKSTMLGLIAGTALSLAAFAADTPANNGQGVTFVNNGSRHLTFYTRFGSENGSCESQPKAETVRVAPSQSVTVDSGNSKVCFCLQVPERRGCPTGWSEVKAGGTRHLG